MNLFRSMMKSKDEQENYFTDYVVVSEPGAYVMQVYSKELLKDKRLLINL